MSDDRVSVGW